jgi:hypothetical protein
MSQATSGFDLSFLSEDNAEQVTARVPVVTNEDGEDVSGFIIVSKDSKQYQEVQAQLRIEGLQKSAKRKSAIDASTDDGARALSRLIAANESRLALSVVIGWFGFTNQGVEVPFDLGTVAKMFEKKPTWQNKVTQALEVESNFTKG